jgi:hypothetical protein
MPISAHRGAAQLAPDQQALGAEHRHAAQHLQQRADHELGLGLRRWRHGGAHHLHTGAPAGVQVDVLGAGREAADGTQQRRALQRWRPAAPKAG